MSAIVTSRNSAATIETCLGSVRRQTYRDVELIVIDNASHDDTPRIAQRFADRVANLGPERSAQRNYGARLSTGEFLLFLDTDMELDPAVLGDCVPRMQDLDAVIIPETTTGTSWLARTRSLERRTYVGSLLFEASRFVRRSTFFELGGYDPALTGLEDYDFEARLEERGRRVGHSAVAILHHEDDLDLGRYLRKRRYYAVGYERYSERHPERARKQFGLERGLFYTRRLGGSPWSLAEVLFLKGMEFVAASLAPRTRPVRREEVY